MREIVVFGTQTCPDTMKTRRHLEQVGASYRFVDTDEVPEAEQWVRGIQNGESKIPVVVIGRTRMIMPTVIELQQELDVVVV